MSGKIEFKMTKDQSEPKELLYFWMSSSLEVLVPKKVGSGFLKVPYGHHANAGLAALDRAAGCDIFGLDGALSFQCGTRVAIDEAGRRAFESKVLPALERHYGWPTREVTATEFWGKHPQPTEDPENLPSMYRFGR